ncbi:peptidase M15 [Bacillus sp. V3-13]|uniref:M15 family metallopeptidase n=1 Tax=Bacillus sp. V3-13 TaxID=2053728 RepID=UPI000C78CD71|nr:M15 family metallopeptidase [Bacillus sp. V3-13]PLR78379.1 peptidase M15 [Bacillus sp. V3-13]
MRRIWIVLGAGLILSGCSQVESMMEKLPFQQDEKESDEQEAKPEEDNVTRDNRDNNEPGQTNTDDSQTVGNNSSAETPAPGTPTLEAAYFNSVIEVNGRAIIQNPVNIMALVNKDFALPDGYLPEGMVRPNVPFSYGAQDIEKSYLRQEAATALENLFAEANRNGLKLYAVSGFRSYERQKELFDAEVSRVGEENAKQAVAVPGNSEHQTGLAMDISSQGAGLGLTEQFGETPEGKWLAENAHRFGFILRYPKGKEKITGYQYEPWHFRYVGEKNAAVIYEKNLTLEEYFNIVIKI